MDSTAHASTREAMDEQDQCRAASMAAVCQDAQANELSTNEIQMSSTLTPEVIRVAPAGDQPSGVTGACHRATMASIRPFAASRQLAREVGVLSARARSRSAVICVIK